MTHFNLKSLAFYGVAIGSVLVLFKVVTAFGETELKARPSIEGRYIMSAKLFPGCLKSEQLILIVQQSGIYLNGSLLPAQKSTESQIDREKSLSLTGKWDSKNKKLPLTLSGSVPNISKCQKRSVIIQGLVDGKTWKGRIKESSHPQEVEFTAKREMEPQKPKTQLH